jgi:uncharacterized protein (DUF1015 family)
MLFTPTDILLPQSRNLTGWSVIACDQFSSDSEYWREVERLVGDAPSTLRLMLPEAYLEKISESEAAASIAAAMRRYRADGVFREIPDSMIYVERTLPDGRVRRGLVGALDLDEYDWTGGSTSAVRASEMTVPERLPPRVAMRRNAPLELPHVMALIDDAADTVIAPVARRTGDLDELYDFALMLGGGRARGWRVTGDFARAVTGAVESLPGESQIVMVDGNHSLAAAKACWEAIKPALTERERATHPARRALVELNNVYDPAIDFLAIHRVVFGVDAASFAARLSSVVGAAGAVGNAASPNRNTLRLAHGGAIHGVATNFTRVGELIAAVQDFIDASGARVDYIHGEAETVALSESENTLALLLPAMEKSEVFATVLSRGVFPRKSFSIGEAREKRYYLECRRIIAR